MSAKQEIMRTNKRVIIVLHDITEINQSINKDMFNVWIKNLQVASLVYHTWPTELKRITKTTKTKNRRAVTSLLRQSDGWSEVGLYAVKDLRKGEFWVWSENE